jgi:hypothetical protein
MKNVLEMVALLGTQVIVIVILTQVCWKLILV